MAEMDVQAVGHVQDQSERLHQQAQAGDLEESCVPDAVPGLLELCATIGVDSLASGKGFWSEMLGVGDFYYELGVQIIEVCLALKHRNGGEGG